MASIGGTAHVWPGGRDADRRGEVCLGSCGPRLGLDRRADRVVLVHERVVARLVVCREGRIGRPRVEDGSGLGHDTETLVAEALLSLVHRLVLPPLGVRLPCVRGTRAGPGAFARCQCIGWSADPDAQLQLPQQAGARRADRLVRVRRLFAVRARRLFAVGLGREVGPQDGDGAADEVQVAIGERKAALGPGQGGDQGVEVDARGREQRPDRHVGRGVGGEGDGGDVKELEVEEVALVQAAGLLRAAPDGAGAGGRRLVPGLVAAD